MKRRLKKCLKPVSPGLFYSYKKLKSRYIEREKAVQKLS